MMRRQIIVELLLSLISAFRPFVSSTDGLIGPVGPRKSRFQSRARTRSILTMKLNPKSLQPNAPVKPQTRQHQNGGEVRKRQSQRADSKSSSAEVMGSSSFGQRNSTRIGILRNYYAIYVRTSPRFTRNVAVVSTSHPCSALLDALLVSLIQLCACRHTIERLYHRPCGGRTIH